MMREHHAQRAYYIPREASPLSVPTSMGYSRTFTVQERAIRYGPHAFYLFTADVEGTFGHLKKRQTTIQIHQAHNSTPVVSN